MKISFSFSISIGRNDGWDENPNTTTVTWGRLRKQVKRRDGMVCRYCGKFTPDGHVDHIIPLSKGGTDAIDNLCWSCRECNLRKGDRDVFECQNVYDKHNTDNDLMRQVVVTVKDGDDNIRSVLPFSLDGIPEKAVIQFAEAVTSGDVISFRRWTGSGNLFSRSQFEDLMEQLRIAGLVIDGAGNLPQRLTETGYSVMEQISKWGCKID